MPGYAEPTLPEGYLMTLWVIYDSPPDLTAYGKRFALRPQFVARRQGVTIEVIGNEVWLADTLEEIRAMIPPTATRLPREPGEAPVIVETWI